MLTPGKGIPIFYKWATSLALITIFSNLIEGVVSVFFGVEVRSIFYVKPRAYDDLF